MPEQSRQAFDQWKQADARARLAEAQLTKTWDDYFSRKGGAPTALQIQEVSQLRAIANDRLTAAMVTLASRARHDTPDSRPSGP